MLKDSFTTANNRTKYEFLFLYQKAEVQCFDLLDVIPEFKSQVKNQNENIKIFLRRLPVSRFLAKTQSK